jgi:hypothetical protein
MPNGGFTVNQKDIQTGVLLLIVALVIWDLSRNNSLIKAAAGQIASTGLDDVLVGLLG